MTQGNPFSRLIRPRTSLAAMVLLALVLGLFGLVASAMHPELGAATPLTMPSSVEGVATLYSNWTLAH